MTVQVDREDRLGARRNGSLNISWIHGERVRINVHQHGPRASIEDRCHTSHESERHSDDFVAGTDSRCQQCEMQGTCPGIESDTLSNTTIAGEFLFKPCNFGAEYELTIV